jgi:hypothetical protein
VKNGLFNFKVTLFTLLKNNEGLPWWVAKELCDYLERCRATLIRQVRSHIEKWRLFSVMAKMMI